MKPKDQGGVVNKDLNVYGTRQLKIAGTPESNLGLTALDLSICPSNVGANTYGTALVIGEKAATIIAAELGINVNGKFP